MYERILMGIGCILAGTVIVWWVRAKKVYDKDRKAGKK